MRPRRVGLVAVALVLAGCGADDDVSIGTSSSTTTTATAAADEVTVDSGVEYGRGEVAGGGSVPLLMDLYVPPGPSDPPRPVVIAIHGGGFARQSRLDPGILVHGDADADVPVTLSDQLAARAEQQGVPVGYHRIPGRGHGYLPSGFYDVPVDGNQTSFDRLVEATVEALT